MSSLAGLFEFFWEYGFDLVTRSVRFESCNNMSKLSFNINSAIDMELIKNAKSNVPSNSHNTLFNMLDTCLTKMGKYALKMNILEPTTNLDDISERQESIEELLRNSDVMLNLSDVLQNMKGIHRLVLLSHINASKYSTKMSEIIMNSILVLLSNLQSVECLKQRLLFSKTLLFERLIKTLETPCLKKLQASIFSILRIKTDQFHELNSKYHTQFLFSIKDGINEILDMLHSRYSKCINKIRDLSEYYVQTYELPFQLLFDMTKCFYLKLNNKSRFKFEALSKDLQLLHRTSKCTYWTSSELCKLNVNIKRITNEIKMMNHM